ncbi:hypothetical protein GQ53DRAFT_743960 [Thozetella sp. PMI_491]|nr:hypothetical protein GQ53DRAFT_743960 [Thozetella sp. PMI_491]
MRLRAVPLLASLLGLAPCPAAGVRPRSRDALHRKDLERRQSAGTGNYTETLEVYKPVPIPTSGVCATETLMVHTFANSYGAPAVVDYTPPACDFNSVIINFTSTVAGRQYDRLAMMYLTDTEVWRTSTAEPTQNGIYWTYIKDLSAYLSLWKQPQTLIFELDNINDSKYTGQYSTTLTATFFKVENAPVKADAILPISSLSGSEGKQSVFSLPSDDATVAYSIPKNVTRAMASISANGQINEEFWYTNVLDSDASTFEDTAGTLLAGGPFREVQLLIDGYLAGVVWPFPVIFTGGLAPGLWRPIVGVEAYDLTESEIDITPFLPYLTDGKPHNFTIKILQLADHGNGSATLTDVESYWLATGKIFLFYGSDTPKKPCSYRPPTITGTDPTIEVFSYVDTAPNGTNLSLSYGVTASREFTVSSKLGSFTQSLAYSNQGFLYDGGLTQTNTQLTSGTQKSVNVLAPSFNQELSFSYPINVYNKYTILPDGANFTINAALTRDLSWRDSGRPDISVFSLVAGPSDTYTTLNGTGFYSSQGISFGTTEQTFTETSYGTTYTRHIKGVNGTIVTDSDASPSAARHGPVLTTSDGFGLGYMGGPRGMIGRGPGSLSKGL